MKSTIYWLGGLLALQLAITAGLFWNTQQQQSDHQQDALLSFDPGAIDRVQLSDTDTTLTLTRTEHGWQLPDELPVDEARLTPLLSRLAQLPAGWPVTTSANSKQRFEVADDEFQRQLRLYQGDDLNAELFLGTSPGFRKVHARRAGEDAVYSVQLNSSDFPTEADGWLDKALIRADEVDRIEGPDYALKKNEDGWHFVQGQGDADNAPELDGDKASQLATALTGLRVLGVSDATPEGDGVELSVSGDEGNWSYRFIEVEDKHYVSRDDLDRVFTLSKADFERITEVGLPQLAVETIKPTEQAPEDAQSSIAADDQWPSG